MIAAPIEAPAKSVGRPRSEGCRQKVLAAADTLLMREGLARMSVDGVAQLAGVSKATIYRWWPNKSAIAMEALLSSSEAEVYVPVSPFPEEDLIAKVRRTIALFRGPRGRVLASLVGQAQSDPEIAEAYRKHLLGPRRTTTREAIERAVEAGIYRADIDYDMAMDIIFGPLYGRLLLGHAPLDDAFERDYPAAVIGALRFYGGRR